MDEVRDWGVHVVMGNCEEQLPRELSERGNPIAATSLTWNARRAA